MQRAFSYERIIIFLGKVPSLMQCASNNANGLKLSTGIADGFFVHSECLGEEFVGNFLMVGLVRDLAACDEEAECHVVEAVDACIEG